MDSFMMAARVVVPMAIMVFIGVLLRIFQITDKDTMKKVDKITYNLLMPTLMFYNIYKTDFTQLKNVGFILYGAAGLTVLFGFALTLVPKFIRNRATAAAYGQAVIRPNYILFGAAVAQSIYGEGNIGLISLMAAVAVPLFNSYSAIVLEAGRHGMASPKKLLKAVVTNPTLIATIFGLLVNLIGLRIPDLLVGVVKDISGLTTPISFLSIGVTLTLNALDKKMELFSALTLRLVIIPLIFVMGGVFLGFRGQELCALLVLFAAPVAVSSYPMAVAMDADGDFAAQMVAVSTLACLPTIFLWTYILNMLQLL